MKTNYQKKLDEELNIISADGKTPKLLLHACCAPCSSYVLEYLSEYFLIDICFYNPNISSSQEYQHRSDELLRFIREKKFKNKITPIIEDYNPDEFFEIINGLEGCKEGGERCFKCYRLRLEHIAKMARDGNYDYFTTTLSISPLKNAEKLNEIGGELEKKYEVSYLYSDFKKKNGYQRSIELSREYNLYRQNFCGCIYSKKKQ